MQTEVKPELVADPVEGALDFVLVVRVGDVPVEVADGVLAERAQRTLVFLVLLFNHSGHGKGGAGIVAQANRLAHLVRLQVFGDHVDDL